MQTENKTLSQLKQIVTSADISKYEELIKALYADRREGVKKLALALNKQYEKNLLEHKRIDNLKRIEEGFRTKGYEYIAGCDEAGRGPLCGPVVSAVVILPKESHILYVNDSKKLNENKREELYEKIVTEAVAFSVGIIDNETIDKINILNATKLSIIQALGDISKKPDILLLDALNVSYDVDQRAFIKGDANLYSIAAASIIAKVTRDRLMYEYDKLYPEYNFASNKGYGTYEHISALKKYGMCPIHRKSFLTSYNLKTPSRIIGEKFEGIACDYLKQNGYEIKGRNFKRGNGEIDIICEKDGIYVFCEVKARSLSQFASPEESVDLNKQSRIKATANSYIAEKAIFTPCRFDIIAFDVLKNDDYELRHHENAF